MQVSSLASTIARRRKYSSFGISRNAFSTPVVRYTHEQPPVVNLLIKAIDVEKGKVNSYHSCYSTMNLYSTHNDGSYVNSYHSCCSILTNYGKRLRLCYVNSYHSCCLTWCRSTPEGDPVAGNSYQSCYSTKEKGMKLYFCTQSTPIRVVAQRCAEPAPDKGIRCQLLS